jgi:hypothetical protein
LRDFLFESVILRFALYDIEEKRGTFLKLEEKMKKDKIMKQKFKSTKQIEKEKSDSRWTST